LGLFGFEVRDDLQVNRTLCLENIIIASIPGRDTIWTVAIESADRLARLHGCETIRASLNDDLDPSDSDRGWVVNSFESAGYSLEGIRASKRIYRLLELSGYARIDFRLDAEGRSYFLEANPNPDIAQGEEFAQSAAHDGVPYPALLDRLLQLGLDRAR
ncbi:MAG: hypothetical protein ACKOC2_03010, partial [Gemmatimonadota bacterium]